MTPTTPTLRTAVHEAAHAVAVFLHRGTITHLSALPDDKFGGVVKWSHGNGSCDACDPITAAIIALAGPAAEAPYLGFGGARESLLGPSRDITQLDHGIGEIAHSKIEAAALAAWLRIHTRELVATPKFARLMEGLLPLLLEHGELDGDVATAALQRAEAAFETEGAALERVPSTERSAA